VKSAESVVTAFVVRNLYLSHFVPLSLRVSKSTLERTSPITLNQFREEVAGEFKEMKSMVRISYAELDRRIQELESNYAALNERVGRLEARIA